MRISDWSSDVCSSDLFGGRLDKRRFGAESAKRRFVAGVHHRLSHANQFTGASLILTGKRQTVARRDRGGKLVAHVECQVRASDPEPILRGKQFGVGERHPRAAPTAHIDPLVDRHRGFKTVEARKGRSEERRVGKECESKCSSRWSPYN